MSTVAGSMCSVAMKASTVFRVHARDEVVGILQHTRPRHAIPSTPRLQPAPAAKARARRPNKAGSRSGRKAATRSPSVSIRATSTPSSEVPLISPIARLTANAPPLHYLPDLFTTRHKHTTSRGRI